MNSHHSCPPAWHRAPIRYLTFLVLGLGLLGSFPAHTISPLRDITFSASEQAWLASNHTISLCVDPDFMPYEQINTQGHHEGMFADFMSFIASRVGIRFQLVITEHFGQSKQYLANGHCSVVSGDLLPDNNAVYTATDPYVTVESGFAVHSSQPDGIDFSAIANGRTGYIKGSEPHTFLADFPDIKLVGVIDTVEGIRKVATGELDSMISVMAVIDHEIRNNGITQVKLGGRFEGGQSVHMLVNNDHPTLVPILNKAIASIGSQERQAITNRWFNPPGKDQHAFDLPWIYLSSILGGLCLFLLVLYNLQQRQNQRKLKASDERFNLAMCTSNDGLWDWNIEKDQIYYSPRWKSMLGYADDELEDSFQAGVQLLDADGHKTTMALVDACLKGEKDGFITEFKMRHKQGHWVDILSRAILIKDDNDQPMRMVGTHVDISSLKRAEEELRQHKQNLEKLVNDRTHTLARAESIAHVGSWQLDITTEQLNWSDETYRIFGIPIGTPVEIRP